MTTNTKVKVKVKVKVNVRFARTRQDVDLADMPKEDGIIVFPGQSKGSWYAVCKNMATSGYLNQRMVASVERPVMGHSTCQFQAGEDYTPAQLKYNLEKAGFVVTFTNEPPWLE